MCTSVDRFFFPQRVSGKDLKSMFTLEPCKNERKKNKKKKKQQKNNMHEDAGSG